MALNLLRDAKVYMSTVATGWSTANTWEVKVLDGFSFSQSTSTQEVTLNEAGAAPNRGQKIFNTALDPVDFSFGTYVRPYMDTLDHACAESVLWDALTNGGVNTGGVATSKLTIDFSNSNAHELPKYYLYILINDSLFVISEAIINSAEVDFSIDGIGMINWTGQGSTYDVTSTPVAGTHSPNPATEVTLVPTTASFLKNKLSTITMTGGPAAGTYTLGLTSASITIDNGVTFLTPEELGVVNKPIGHFTGTRAISGSFSCYLDTAANHSMALLSDMLTDVNGSTPTVTNSFNIVLSMGGASGIRVAFNMPKAHIVIPQIESEDVISTSIEFTALGTGLTTTDEMTIDYYAE